MNRPANQPETTRIDTRQGRSEAVPVAAKSATGIGVPLKERVSAHTLMHGAFFLPAAFVWATASQFYGGRCAGGFGPAGTDSFPVRQPAPSATPIGVGMADSTEQKESTMSKDPQGTPVPAFQPGEATFTAPFGHTLQIEIGPDYLAAFVRVDGADTNRPLVSLYAYRPARSARINRVPLLVVGDAYLPLPTDAHAAAVAFLGAHGAYSRTEGIDA